jgi:L-seryl-tRNA(Ser) seleniumtransferase
MLATSQDTLRDTADRLRGRLRAVVPPKWELSVEETTAEVGGGSLPEAHLPSFAVALRAVGLSGVDTALRAHHPPVYARLFEGALLLDVRTLLPGDEEVIVSAFAAASGRA